MRDIHLILNGTLPKDGGRFIYVHPMIWAAEENIDPGSICLVLTSDLFHESDYYRNYKELLQEIMNKDKKNSEE